MTPMFTVRPRAIPGQDKQTVATFSVITRPGQRSVALSVDPLAISRGPIHRGDGPPYLIDSGPPPRRLTEQADQRRGFVPAVGNDSHLSRFRERHPERRAVALTGAGNVGLNLGVQAAFEGRVLGPGGPFGGALSVVPDGSGEITSILEVPETGFAITGPLLVRDGAPSPLSAATFADPRHLLLFPFTEVAPGTRVDFGHDRLLSDPAQYATAASGAPVRLPLTVALPETDAVDSPHREYEVDPAALRSALDQKGYREVEHVDDRGTCRLHGDHLEIAFLEGIYPHHVLCVLDGGAVASLLVTGLSNRAGVRLTELAEDLAAAGVRDALLSDNGGDVGLYLPEEASFAVRPAEPDRSATWPLAACLVYHEPAD